MARLPKVGDDSGKWGDILNDYLRQAHSDDGALRAGSVTAATIADGSAGTAQIADRAITEEKLSAEVRALIGTGDIPDGSIGETKLEASVKNKLNATIAAGSVTTEMLAPGAVTPGRIEDGAVLGGKIADAAVTEAKLATSLRDKLNAGVADGSISTAKLANRAVTAEKISGIGQANGIVPTGADGRVPEEFLPDRLTDQHTQDLIDHSIHTGNFAVRDSALWLATDHGVQEGLGAPNQAPAIQAALTALSATGGGTLLFVGSFRIDTGAISGADNVIMQGAYGAQLVKTSAGSVLMNWTGRRNWAIRDFDIDFGSKNYGSTSAGFDGWENGIRVTNCEDFEISGNTLRRGARTISLRNTATGTGGIVGCSRARIVRNRFIGETRDICIDMQQPAAPGAGVRGIAIENNHVESVLKSFLDGGAWTAFYVNGGKDLRFVGNRVESSDDTAIMVNNSDHYEISGNHLRTKQLCIYAGASRWGRITSNDMSSIHDIGLSLHARDQAGEPFESGTVVAQNVITDCGRNGIAIEGTQRVTITGNYIENCCTSITTSSTVTDTARMISYIPSGFANVTRTNTGTSVAYVGYDSNLTTGNGTPISPGATHVQPAGTSLWAVTANTQQTTLTSYAADLYKSALGAWGIGSRKPRDLTISANTIVKGASSEALYAVSVTDSPQDILITDNNVSAGFSFRFRYGTLSGRFQVQTSVGQRQNYTFTAPAFGELASNTPLAAAVAYHPTHRLIYGDGTNWYRVSDDVQVTP